MSVKFKPVKHRLVVEFAEEIENKSKGGIILPDSASKEKPQMGTVIALGSDEDMNKDIKKGDTVIFGKYAGTEVTFEEKKYLILNFDDVLTVVKS